VSEYLNLCETITVEESKRLGPFHTWSEKLDGMRCLWDGGISRGHMTNVVPWARTGPKGPALCTGLYSREGNPIYAPGWWLDRLGDCLRDGELWMGYKWRGDLLSICKQGLEKSIADPRWQRVQLHQYGQPNASFFRDRVVRVRGTRLRFCSDTSAYDSRITSVLAKDSTFENSTVVKVTEHQGLPCERDLLHVLSLGGEGLVIKDGRWRTERKGWYKIKPFDEMTCTITGYVPGLGKYTGMLGSYTCTDGTNTFNVSGMDDSERSSPRKLGTVIEVRYRGRNPSGAPCECRIVNRIGD